MRCAWREVGAGDEGGKQGRGDFVGEKRLSGYTEEQGGGRKAERCRCDQTGYPSKRARCLLACPEDPGGNRTDRAYGSPAGGRMGKDRYCTLRQGVRALRRGRQTGIVVPRGACSRCALWYVAQFLEALTNGGTRQSLWM